MSGLQQGNVVGQIGVRQKISGKLAIGQKTFKELRFLPFSEFPLIGDTNALYVDTENDVIYYYDGHYIVLSSSEQAQIIDDLGIALNKTWSSSKIDAEFQSDREQIDTALNTQPITNSEIEDIIGEIF